MKSLEFKNRPYKECDEPLKTDKMNIENHLKEIGNYFKAKVLAGDFEFIKCSIHTAEIKIDNKYTFELWIANEPKYDFRFYGISVYTSNFDCEFDFKNMKERLTGYSKVKKYIKEYSDTVLKKEKIAQFNKLKKELNMECKEL